MNSKKTQKFVKENAVELEIFSALSPKLFRAECVRMVCEYGDNSKEAKEDYEKEPLADNIYQHLWRKVYQEMDKKVGINPYQMLQIDNGAKIKLESLQGLGLDKFLFSILRNMY